MKLSLHTIKHLKPSDTTQGPKLAKLQLLFPLDNLTHIYIPITTKNSFRLADRKLVFGHTLTKSFPDGKHQTYTKRLQNTLISAQTHPYVDA